MERKLILIGASGHGKVIADIAVKNGYEVIGFLDDNPEVKSVMDFPVIGKVAEAEKYIDKVSFCVSIGNAAVRKRIMSDLMEKGAEFPCLIHPNAVIGMQVQIDAGSVVMAGAIINSCAQIGKGCIVNTSASVDHDCKIEDYVHVSVGAHVAGNVNIGEATLVGAGAIVKNNVTVCPECMIGAGAVVVKNIREKGTYIGVPARIK